MRKLVRTPTPRRWAFSRPAAPFEAAPPTATNSALVFAGQQDATSAVNSFNALQAGRRLPEAVPGRENSTRPGKVVVDAGIVAKWFLPECYADSARKLTSGRYEVLVPDLMFSELGSILERHVNLGTITQGEALSIVQVLSETPLRIHRTWSLALTALDIQRRTKREMYHSIHLALAIREGAILVVGDERFYRAVRLTSLAGSVRWIEDVE